MRSLESMRCVILGAGGFIGTNLTLALRGRADYVRAYGRRQAFPAAVKGVDWYPADFCDATSIPSAIAGCDTVFHLLNASTPSSANVDKVADLQANVVSTLHLLEACRAEGVKRIVFASSGGTVYGIPQQVPTSEAAETYPITAYGISKLAIEKYLSLYRHLYGLDYRVLRVANPFGPYQLATKSQGVISAFLARALAGDPVEVWGDGSVVRDYVYIEDVVQAFIRAALHDGEERIFNIGSGEGRSIRDVIRAIEVVLARPIEVAWRPGRTVDVPISILDVRRAEKELGWAPTTDFLVGLQRTAAWFDQQCVR